METTPFKPTEIHMHISSLFRHIVRGALAAVCLFAPLSPLALQPAYAQKKGAVAPPGDSLPTPGPLARDLSPNFSKADLARVMKLVADWQLTRQPATPQT